jgi:putative YphP/YqiW family bacilliredoxin
MYDPIMTAPMRDELVHAGVRSLSTAAEVDAVLTKKQGTAMVVVNSVCGCAAANARPGAILALRHAKKPADVVTVFAGVDPEATNRARSYFKGYMPSSPSIAVFKDGQIVFMLQRHDIEGRDPQAIAKKLTDVFDKVC